jgi:hypothetical protein
MNWKWRWSKNKQGKRKLEDKENELNKKTDFVENELKHSIELNESKIQKILLEKENCKLNGAFYWRTDKNLMLTRQILEETLIVFIR